jgi:serine/threonine protein phosphatase PrpC
MDAMATDERFVIVTGRSGVGGSRRGPRHVENEDNLRLHEPEAGDARFSHGNLYIVADGVGGHMKGEVASALAVDELTRAYFEAGAEDPSANLLTAINAANLRIHESAEAETDEGPPMATTVVVAAVLKDQIVVANVGDSRAYIVGDGVIRQISHDHSWVQDQLDSGRMTVEEARISPRRNVITRALGLGVEVEAELKTESDPSAHTRLVLCTDGVHGVIDDDELAALVEGHEPQAAVERILARVDERQGRDDATIIIVDLAGRVEMDEPERTHEPGFIPRVRRLFRRRR